MIENTRRLCFCVWFTSLRLRISSLGHVVANDRIDFLNDFFSMTNLRKKKNQACLHVKRIQFTLVFPQKDLAFQANFHNLFGRDFGYDTDPVYCNKSHQ